MKEKKMLDIFSTKSLQLKNKASLRQRLSQLKPDKRQEKKTKALWWLSAVNERSRKAKAI